MGEEQKDSTSETVKKKSLRPALIASEKTVSEYSIFLEHLLVGLADESIPAALVCRPGCDVDSVVSPAVEVLRHPVFNLPLMGRQNKKILLEKLEKFKPTVLHCLCESKASLTRQLARQLGLPYVLTVNSLQKRFNQLSISSKRLAKIIVPAESIAVNIAKVYPRFAERIEQVNIGTFASKTTGCFGKPGQLASMVTAGPLRSESDFENLLGAVKHLAIDGYEFMLVVIGGGRAERGLRKLLAELGLLQIVTIVPKLQPWRAVLAAGDIFIQPVADNAFNPLLLEAMRKMLILSNERYRAVKITLEKDLLDLVSTNPDLGEGQEKIEIKYEGERIEAGFNPKYFIDILQSMESDMISMEFTDSAKPCVLKGDADEGFIGLIMPMRV